MSGGSYDYLYRQEVPELLSEAMTDGSSLSRMSADLAALGYAAEAANETEELILILRAVHHRVEARRKRLADVWHAMEWWKSCDYGEDQFKEVLAKYRGEGGPWA